MGRKTVKQSTSQPSSAPAETTLARILRRATPSNGADEREPLRPAVEAEEVEALAFHGLEPAAIALLLGCDPTRLSNEFSEAIRHGRARWQLFLRERLAAQVDQGEWRALKFALQNFCGMADNPAQAALQQYKLAQLRPPEAARPGAPAAPSLQPPTLSAIEPAAAPSLPGLAVPRVPKQAPRPRLKSPNQEASNASTGIAG